MELTLDQALQKGIEVHKAGNVQDADRYYTAILKVQPEHPDANHNMGVLAVGIGKVEEAIPFFKKALEANSTIPQFWLSYIDALIKLDRIIDAKAVFDEAKNKEVKGDGFDKLEERLGRLKILSAKEPTQDHIMSLADLYKQGKYQEVLAQASRLLVQFPNSINLYNIIGAANKCLGNIDEAIEVFTKAISIKPDNADAYYNMGNALRGVIFTNPNRDLQKNIGSLLNKKIFIRPSDIAKAVISLLKLEPTLQSHLQLVDDEIIHNPLGIISDLSELSLLLQLMRICPLPDLEVEKLLKNLRRSILFNISFLKKASAELLSFQSALAMHCFTNEYIYSLTEEEEEILQSLDASIKKALENKEQPSPQALLALASYKALHKYDWCKLLVITDHIKEIFISQIEEPKEEEKLKQDLPVLEEITDKISSKVREQYEESPYPRWVNLKLLLKPMPISNFVDEADLKLYDNEITKIQKPEILIAGCGTGQHSIKTAARFKSSKVLAIDLSLSSLAYAKRKTEELAVENIEYMQADILDLGLLNKQFDIIESAGVLHHMDDPMAGWKELTDCLAPGGLMKIGLYSELARRDVIKIREDIKQQNIQTKDLEMRSFRDMIIKSDEDYHKLITKSSDFYSLSTLKDLLFHVQEHRFTIPQIKDNLDKLGLKFCGFEPQNIISNFKKTNKNKNDPYNLDKWQAYEEANPTTFAGMYQFWCQKIG